MNSQSPHLDPETLAMFAEGRLDAANKAAAIAHLDRCDDCMNDVALVMPSAGEESERRRFSKPTWFLALAAALVLAVALPVMWHFIHGGSPTDELVSLSPHSARIVEPRLTGGFPWAAYHGPMRAAGGSVTDAERLKLGGAAGELMQRAEHDPSADAQHAAGVAMVLVEKPEEAIAKLESAARASHDAKSWSDLAAARYAAAVQYRRPSLYPEALAASDDALRIDARLPEALFNRALILENMGLISAARRAWQRYLEVDPGSQWANEARAHLAELPVATGASRWERDQPLLEAAAAAGDARKTLALVDAYRERSRRFAEAEYLGRWAEAEQQHNDAEATKWLAISRGIGTALAQLSGESLLRDAVRVIDGADAESRPRIAQAHVTYRRGRLEFSHQQVQAGERDLRLAAGLFKDVNDPMALMAGYYAAAARLARNEIAPARAELEQLRAAADAHPTYLVLGAQVRWELARAIITEGDRSSQIQTLTAAADLFGRAGERLGEADVRSALAVTYSLLGHPDEAWAARIQAFQEQSVDSDTPTFERSVEAAVHSEVLAGRTEPALALANVAEALRSPETMPLVAIENLLQKAMLESSTGKIDEGMRTARQAEDIAGHLSDRDVQLRQLADIDIARGALLLNRDRSNALISLTRAIDFFRSRRRTAKLPEPLLLRSRCETGLGDASAAARDLEEGVQTIEHHPVRYAGVVLGTGVFNVGQALFTDAIRLHLDQGATSAAFMYAERSLGADAISIEELRRRLEGSGAAILEIVLLPGEVVTLAISESDVKVSRWAQPSSEIVALAERVVDGDERASEALYEAVIRPADQILSRATSVVIVPDRLLAGVPFASLTDRTTGRRLIERMPIAIASNASSLRSGSGPARKTSSMAGIALPSGDASTLPDSERELTDVAGLYSHSTAVPPRQARWEALQRVGMSADVIHIVGHTEHQPGDGGEALLFAGSGSSPLERVSWKTILTAPALHARVVVLAACETLRPPTSATRALSLGAAFAAGGADVIGTLAPIPDRDAHILFRSIHRELAAGVSAMDALHTAQLEAIRAETADGGTRAWRAVAVLTRQIPH
jgi:tetratricopeptide (TPR) repeat protein